MSLDFDKPLKGFNESAYEKYPIRGSMALTERGHKVLELLEIQGLTDLRKIVKKSVDEWIFVW